MGRVMDSRFSLKRLGRHMMSRGLEFSVEEMSRFGLLRIENSVTHVDYIEALAGYTKEFVDRCEGGVGFVDVTKGSGGDIVTMSALHFRDFISYSLFLYSHWEWYWDSPLKGESFGFMLN